MAIDPYEPELAKRKTAFQIAHKQLNQVMSQLTNQGKSLEFKTMLTTADEALKDYRQSAYSLSEWLNQKETNS